MKEILTGNPNRRKTNWVLISECSCSLPHSAVSVIKSERAENERKMVGDGARAGL